MHCRGSQGLINNSEFPGWKLVFVFLNHLVFKPALEGREAVNSLSLSFVACLMWIPICFTAAIKMCLIPRSCCRPLWRTMRIMAYASYYLYKIWSILKSKMHLTLKDCGLVLRFLECLHLFSLTNICEDGYRVRNTSVFSDSSRVPGISGTDWIPGFLGSVQVTVTDWIRASNFTPSWNPTATSGRGIFEKNNKPTMLRKQDGKTTATRGEWQGN